MCVPGTGSEHRVPTPAECRSDTQVDTLVHPHTVPGSTGAPLVVCVSLGQRVPRCVSGGDACRAGTKRWAFMFSKKAYRENVTARAKRSQLLGRRWLLTGPSGLQSGPVCGRPWAASGHASHSWAPAVLGLCFWTRGPERICQLLRMPVKPHPKWNHLERQAGFVCWDAALKLAPGETAGPGEGQSPPRPLWNRRVSGGAATPDPAGSNQSKSPPTQQLRGPQSLVLIP